ncbi:MAG: EamA family transporter [Alphaproteobacteria bacterium]|nr:EamA family transporter [Alphaproteobacteria bacterium]
MASRVYNQTFRMTKNRPFLGIAYFIAASFQTAAVEAVTKYLTDEMHALQIVCGYFTAIAFFLLLYAAIVRMPLHQIYVTGRPGLQFLRAASMVLTLGTLFAGLKYIPLADATAITFSAPLIITALSAPILGEKVGIHRWSAVVVGMAGVLIIIQPGDATMHWAVLLPLAAAVGFAIFQIVTRQLAYTEAAFVTLLYTSAGGALMSSVLMMLVWTPLDVRQTAILLGIGALGAGAHVCFFRAFVFAQASFVAPFNYVKLIWVTAFGYMLFGDIPASHVILGSGVIIASGLYVLMRERRRAS